MGHGSCDVFFRHLAFLNWFVKVTICDEWGFSILLDFESSQYKIRVIGILVALPINSIVAAKFTLYLAMPLTYQHYNET